MLLRPEVLTHPNIPKPLHGLSPRSVKGKEWWDITRKDVYRQQEYRCIACGVHKRDAAYHNWIEAHEEYTIDYDTGVMKIKDIVGLCHSCHNFIHCGRMFALVQKGETSGGKMYHIMQRGFKVLRGASLTPWYGQCLLYIELLKHMGKKIDPKLVSKGSELFMKQEPVSMQQDWSKWHLILEGEKHYSKFKNQREWERYYD